MTGRGTVRFGDATIAYEVRRSERRRKTVQITVDGGGVLVVAPAGTPDADVRAIVRRRAPWIIGHAADATLEAAPKRFVSGETLPYLGRNVRMVVESSAARSPRVRLDRGRFRIAVPEGLDGSERAERVRRAVVGWYRTRAAERLRAGVERWRPRLGVGAAPTVLIRDQRRRWGSCAPDGTLRFNWRAVMLAPALIDYVVVHELAHLTSGTTRRTSGGWCPGRCPTRSSAAADCGRPGGRCRCDACVRGDSPDGALAIRAHS